MATMKNQEKRDLAKEATQAVLDHWNTGAPDDRLAHLLRHVNRGFRRSLEFRLSGHEVSFGHWIILRVLWQEDGLSQRDISVQAGIMEPTAHTAIIRMETLGLIKRRHLKDNKKRMHVFLTAKGKKLESHLVPGAQEINNIAVKGIDDQDVLKLRSMLFQIIENLAVDEANASSAGQKIVSTRSQAQR